MLKQSAGRNQRTKGFKVKHGLKIFILIAVGVWLLYQLKHSHDKKAYEESSAKIFEKLDTSHETKNLGRKGFQPWINKPYGLIHDAEESKPEKLKERSSGGEEDDVVGHDIDRAEEEEPEEVEDLIDEEDKEREEENEEEEGEDMGKLQIEYMNLLEDQDHNEGGKDKQVTSEKKHYKKNGASRIVMRKTQNLGTEFEFGG